MNEKKNTVLMTEGGIFKNLLFFATPLILGNLLQQMYNAVHSIIVGNYVGSNALAAVGAGASLIYLLIAFSLGASVGAGVIVSQYLGAKEKEGVHKAVHTAMTISIILGLILTAGGILFSRKLLVMMNTPAVDCRLEDRCGGSSHCDQLQPGNLLHSGTVVPVPGSGGLPDFVEKSSNSQSDGATYYPDRSAYRNPEYGHFLFQYIDSGKH